MRIIKINLLVFFILSLFAFSVKSQVGGNQVYKERYPASVSQNTDVQVTDSTLTIESKILLNKKADFFKISLGLSQEAKSPMLCEELMTKRIKSFSKAIYKLGIDENNIYTDFITQNRVYDYKQIGGQQMEQYLKGFILKKNLIITVTDVEMINKIMVIASQYDIYDLIKVDYANDNMSNIYQQLFKEATKVIEFKKEICVNYLKCKIDGIENLSYSSAIAFPKNRYSSYTAPNEGPDAERSSSYVKINAPKYTTYYYEGLDTSTFDKVIGNASPEVGIQYTVEMFVIYRLKKK